MENIRKSGILAHPTSFPSPFGIGDMGKGAYDFLDFLLYYWNGMALLSLERRGDRLAAAVWY